MEKTKGIILSASTNDIDPISKVTEYKTIPKYNLKEMFKEPDSCDYKVACKYDSMLELNEINHRVATKACVTR
jgi:hypothetical protein